MTVYRSIKRQIGLTIPLVFLLAGCGPSQQEMIAKDRLQEAQTAYRQAAADRDVQTYAQVQLNEAGNALQQAEGTGDYGEMEARAYVAEKKARTAQAIAEGKKAENEVQLLRKENTEALLRK